MKYPPVRFTGKQARAIGRGFSDRARNSSLTIWACSILPEHVHLVIARHRYRVEQIANLLKGEATRQMIREDLHPFAVLSTHRGRPPAMWGRGQWKVFLNSGADIRRAIRYVEHNPLKEGKPRQGWPFVRPFNCV